MNIDWLNRENKNSTLIIFCNGWGMDRRVVSHLQSSGFDIAAISAYDTISPPKEIIKEAQFYQQRFLIGWSMGVWMGAVFFTEFMEKDIDFTAAIAVNGTLSPLSDRFGIPPIIFQEIYNTFNREVCSDFYKQMCGKSYSYFCKILPQRTLASQKEELLFFLHNADGIITNSGEKFAADFYNCAIISKRDRIILAKNQKRFWQEYGVKNIIHYTGSHYIFNDFSSWQEIINLVENCER